MNSSPDQRQFFAALALCACMAGPAFADGPPKDVVVFGDSLSDPGNAFALTHKISTTPYDVIPYAPYAVGGLHFSNGKTWIEQLPAESVNSQSSGPAYQLHGVFTNYAVGDARARDGVGSISLHAQVQTYLADFGGHAKAGSIHVIFIGGNDIQDALRSPNPIEVIQAAVTAVSNQVMVLYGAGATTFVIVSAPNVGVTPAIRMADAQYPGIAGAAMQLSYGYQQGLEFAASQLGALPGIHIKTVDLVSAIDDVVANPGEYGLRNVSDMCITPFVQGNAKCSNPNDYLFWDGIHPTSAGHALLAERIGAAF